MELTDDQKKVVAQWVAQGDGLSEIQKKIRSEWGISMTFMDVRFLVLDLGVAVKDKPDARRPVPAAGAAKEDDYPAADEIPEPGQAGVSSEAVSVDVDRVMKPGSMVSGSVTFSDGVHAKWMLDQFGRLALEAAAPGYAPPEEDIRVFQEKLREALRRRGF